MKKFFILAGVFCALSVSAQTVIKSSTVANATAASPFVRNGTIELVFPPGTGSADYSLVRAPGSVWDNDLIDGVTVQLNFNSWAQINAASVGGQQFYIPTTNPTGTGSACDGKTAASADTDTCIIMRGAQIGSTFVPFPLPIFFPGDWSTIESTTSPGINQWFQATPSGKRKQVNLLDFSQSNGSVNGSTPSYVGTTTYLAQFTPGTQDFLNSIGPSGNICTNQYAGHAGIAASRSGTTTVTATLNSHGYTTGQTIWVNATAGSGTFSQYSNTTTGVVITVTGANTFTYTVGTSATDTATLTLVADSESYVVPYELPYLVARQAFIKATFLHYNASYTNAVGGTAAQLNYWRGGQSAGGEVFPFCYSNMGSLSPPYTLALDTATAPGTGSDCFIGGCTNWGFVDYYNNDLKFVEGLHPFMRVATSLNNGGTGSLPNNSYSRTESTNAAARTNGNALFDIIGEQGASVDDITAYFLNPTQAFSTLNPPNMCGNNGCNNVTANFASGMPIEFQVISISSYRDAACNPAENGGSKCSVPSTTTGGDSGDMRQMLAFYTGLPATDGTNTVTLAGHASIYECYYRDCALALDPNFCALNGGATTCTSSYTNVSSNYTWYLYSSASAYEFHAFQAVGLGPLCGAQYTSATLQAGGTGDCSYALALKNFHGQH